MNCYIKELNTENFDDCNRGIAVLDFWAEWCGPCKMLAPEYDSAAEKLHNDAAFFKVNVDDNEQISADFKIYAIPTIVVLKDGKEITRKVGLASVDDIARLIKND